MAGVIIWLQDNWLEAAMLASTLITVGAAIVAVRVAGLALQVARRAAQSSEDAYERSVRLQARTALAETRGSYNKLATAFRVNQEKWRQHQTAHRPKLSAIPFAPTQEMRDAADLVKQGAAVLRSAAEKLHDIDRMTPGCLEGAIPEICHATSEIEALMRCLQEPKAAFH